MGHRPGRQPYFPLLLLPQIRDSHVLRKEVRGPVGLAVSVSLATLFLRDRGGRGTWSGLTTSSKTHGEPRISPGSGHCWETRGPQGHRKRPRPPHRASSPRQAAFECRHVWAPTVLGMEQYPVPRSLPRDGHWVLPAKDKRQRSQSWLWL